MTLSLVPFLASVIAISLSGVMAPGPVTAATISKGRLNGNAGAYIAVGHGVIEIPLMILIYLGFTQLLITGTAKSLIGIVGGSMLIYMGISYLKTPFHLESDSKNFTTSSLVAGIIATGANPYFILWWATIGAALILTATNYGILGFTAFAVTHWSCDLVWDLIVSKIVHKTKRIWNPLTHKVVNLICSAILVGFGIWFIYSALNWITN